MVEQLLESDDHMGRAYEGLAVLDGTAANVKEAWTQ